MNNNNNQDNKIIREEAHARLAIGLIFLLGGCVSLFDAINGHLSSFFYSLVLFIVSGVFLLPRKIITSWVRRISPARIGTQKSKLSKKRWIHRAVRTEALIYWVANFGSIGIFYMASPYAISSWSVSPWLIIFVYMFVTVAIGLWYLLFFAIFYGWESVVYSNDLEYGVDPVIYKKQTLTLAALVFWSVGAIILGPFLIVLALLNR